MSVGRVCVYVCVCVLLAVVSGVTSCLQCDRVVLHMHEDFLSAVAGLTVQELQDLQNIINSAYRTYQSTSLQLHAVIDSTTLYRVRTEYQSEFYRHWKEPRKGSVQGSLMRIVEKGNRILKKHLELFVAEGLCPNECGLLYQSVMNCSSCQYGLYKCQSATPPTYCGEWRMEVEEGGQVVLDCFLSWHSLIVGKTEYHYYWIQGARNFSADAGFEVLVVTEDSKIVLNQLSVREQGVYRCLLLDKQGTQLSSMHFILTVIPSPSTSTRLIPSLPPPPSTDYRSARLHPDSLIITLIIITVLSISASLIIILIFSVRMVMRWRKNEGRREKEKEEKT